MGDKSEYAVKWILTGWDSGSWRLGGWKRTPNVAEDLTTYHLILDE